MRLLLLAACAAAPLAGCSSQRGSSPSPSPATETATPRRTASTTATDIRVTIVQLNDLYEITPVSGGRWGGPARVATLIRRLEAWNPNTIAILAGDFLSPSALGVARVEGEPLAGRQMVEVLDAMGLDYATFGNHEFDLDEGLLRDRIAASGFEWFSANVRDASGNGFAGVDDLELLRFVGSAGDTLRLGLIGVTRPEMAPDWVQIGDPILEARRRVELLTDSTQALVALTHLSLSQDIALAEALPELDLIMGGHDHENVLVRRGPGLTPIAKADANVRSVFVHELRWDPRTSTLDIESRLVPITDEIPDDPTTESVVDRWLQAGWAGFREDGFEPGEVVANVTEPLDGLESSVRLRPTTLTDIIVSGMRREVPGVAGAILNGGSIRIDDVIAPGPLTQYDVIRALPFGGPVVEAEMTGLLLARVLTQGRRNVGEGGFLHTAGFELEADGEGWRVGGEPLDPTASYRVAIADFLLSGREQGLGFLNPDNPALTILAEHRDLRLVLIDELRLRYGGTP
jgi:5'-nucleotidase